MKIKFKFDPKDLANSIKKDSGKHLISDGFSVIPIYKGKTYSIQDVVNKDGSVNVKKAKQIMEEVAEYFGGKKMQHRLENPKWHKEDPNTWLHTKKVAQNAWNIPSPEGYTKQDQMVAALGHDFGKMLSGDGHAEISYELIKQIFPDATPKQLEAIRKHMDALGSQEDLLEIATKFADLGVTPTADLSTLGLTPEELGIINKTKWFKAGGVIKASLGAVFKHAADDLVFKQMDDAISKIVPKAVTKELSKKVVDKVILANPDGTVFRLYEKLGDGSVKVVGQLNIYNVGEYIKPIYVEKVNKSSKEVSKDLYDAAMAFHNKPLKSGEDLLMPSTTRKIQDKYFDKYTITESGGIRENGSSGKVVLLMQPSQEVTQMKPWGEGLAIKLKEYTSLPSNKPYPKFLDDERQRYQDTSNLLDELEKNADLGLNMDKQGGVLNKYGLGGLDNNPKNVYMLPLVAGVGLATTVGASQDTQKLQEGGILIPEVSEGTPRQPELSFRHLKDEFDIENFNKAIYKLFRNKQIKNDTLTKKAEQELQRKFNLDKTQLKETLEDLFNLQPTDSEMPEFKMGGTIQKYSMGSAIKKFVGENLNNLNVATKVENTLTSSGATKVIGKATAEHLRKAANATGDKRIEVLADFAETCRNKGIKLPEEFNSFIDAIFKTPEIVTKDTKKIKVGKTTTAEPELVEWHGLTQERPTWEKTSAKYITVHDDNYKKDSLKFVRTIPKSQEDLLEISPKLDEAIQSLKSIMEGDFKLTESMLDEIYLKSKGNIQSFQDNISNTKELRKLFGRIEYPEIVKRQLQENYKPIWNKEGEQVLIYRDSLGNIDWFRNIREVIQRYVDTDIYYTGARGEVKIIPQVITPKEKFLEVYAKTPDGVIFPGIKMIKKETPFVKGYIYTVDGKRIPGSPRLGFQQHHSTPLALMEAEAYIANPSPTSPINFAHTYQEQRKINGTKEKHYSKFWPLSEQQHKEIHRLDKFSLQDLQRIKALSRSGRFKTMDQLITYYNQLKSKQLSYFN